jgi:flagellar basal-body rod protein FlgB
MSSAFDRFLGISASAVSLHRARLDQLSSNIANADTPKYLAKDLDFQSVLRAQVGQQTGVQLVRTSPSHMQLAGVDEPALVYRIPMQPAQDGNTVELATENAKFSETALHYQASLTFVERRIKSLLTAITGSDS